MLFFFFNDTATTEIYTLSLHDALPIYDVELGAGTCVDRGALGETRVGRGTKIDNLVQVAHNVSIGERVVIAAQTGISGSTVIESDAVIGGQGGVGGPGPWQARAGARSPARPLPRTQASP